MVIQTSATARRQGTVSQCVDAAVQDKRLQRVESGNPPPIQHHRGKLPAAISFVDAKVWRDSSGG